MLDQPPATARERLVQAAFELFEEQGYAGTTVEEIAARAGTGRTTFFRNFRSKEDVVFPDHDRLVRLVDARLATATALTGHIALPEAAEIVLDHYLHEGDTARTRYRLTSTVEALRDRESSSIQRYLRLFTQHLNRWSGDDPNTSLRSELLASAVITAHNHVLRRWLRGLSDDPRAEFAAAMRLVQSSNTDSSKMPSGETQVVIVRSEGSLEEVTQAVRSALRE